MISRAVLAPSAHHADPDVDRPPGYAYGCAQITRIGTASGDHHSDLVAEHIGGSARGYQESFVPLARIAVPVTTWLQPRRAVYFYIAALEATVRFCRCVCGLNSRSAVLWPGVAGCCRRGGGGLGEPGVQPCPDLLRGAGAAAPLVPGDHYPAGRHACEGGQAEYLLPAHLPRLRLCLACASAWMRPWT